MKSWVFTTQALMLWCVGMYAMARPKRANWALIAVYPAAVVLPLIVAWLAP